MKTCCIRRHSPAPSLRWTRSQCCCQDGGRTPGCTFSGRVWETPAVLGVLQLHLLIMFSLFSHMRKRYHSNVPQTLRATGLNPAAWFPEHFSPCLLSKARRLYRCSAPSDPSYIPSPFPHIPHPTNLQKQNFPFPFIKKNLKERERKRRFPAFLVADQGKLSL